MKKLIQGGKALVQNGNGHRLATTGIGLIAANFIISLLNDQMGVGIHPNTAATGALLLAAVINKVVGKYFKTKEN